MKRYEKYRQILISGHQSCAKIFIESLKYFTLCHISYKKERDIRENVQIYYLRLSSHTVKNESRVLPNKIAFVVV